MANVFDYLARRGHVSISFDGLQEVDHLIFSRVSYFPFEAFMTGDETLTFCEAYQRFLMIDGVTAVDDEDAQLFAMMAQSRRFGSLLLHSFSYSFDEKMEKQFAVVSVCIDPNLFYISYRGTDNTFVGWKEDFNMGFMKHVPAQDEAVSYLEMMASQYDGKFILGGHSKGGNLAVYAGSFCDEMVQRRVLAIYNFDGPGLCFENVCDDGYLRMADRIFAYVPQSSVIGLLLWTGDYQVVLSDQVGILQHNLYSWQISGVRFITLSEVDQGSLFLHVTIHKWLDRLSFEKREQFVDILFEILMSTGMDTVSQFQEHLVSNTVMIMKKYRELDDESKRVVMEVIWSLGYAMGDNFLDNF